jgi:stringent starvation protein B
MEQTEFLRRLQNFYLHGRIPVIQINTSLAPCFVPHDLVENDIININIHPTAVTDFKVEDTFIRFKSWFDSKCYVLEIPLIAIIDIISAE